MPVPYLRRLTGKERSQKANRHLALILAFVAGAANAGGYLAVRQYTSHMSGVVASIADNMALGEIALVGAGFSALLSFLAGAACTALLVNWGRRRRMQSEYAFPLLLEAALLLTFGLIGSHLQHNHWRFVSATISLLCFTMGLQNAIITKISKAEIRTTHVTGMVTDIGIELGKLLYWNRSQDRPKELHVHADLGNLWLLVSLVGLFFFGGVIGALGFKHAGYLTTVPLALLLLILAVVPVTDDLFRTEPAH
jgi:uncharacterized membrane protein YoaK (UPF0700 family)